MKILLALCIVFGLCMVISIIMLCKNDNTAKNQKIILNALYNYNVDMIYRISDDRLPYDCMRSYNSTLLRFWDWGYKNILPKDQFEIIKKYIKV